ncbi:hypothetical protein H0H87_001599 [Tephrocybe sp. NHM501043]|nr:hypothetical protein H0H87_001599 [Tephrocybe sp. NHM501043]
MSYHTLSTIPISSRYSPEPAGSNPRNRYLAALAAEANYLAVEAAQRKGELLSRRLEEIQLCKIEEESLHARSTPHLSELAAYQAIYGFNYILAYQRDYAYMAALAECQALKAGIGRCSFDECVSSLYPHGNSYRNSNAGFNNSWALTRPASLAGRPVVVRQPRYTSYLSHHPLTEPDREPQEACNAFTAKGYRANRLIGVNPEPPKFEHHASPCPARSRPTTRQQGARLHKVAEPTLNKSQPLRLRSTSVLDSEALFNRLLGVTPPGRFDSQNIRGARSTHIPESLSTDAPVLPQPIQKAFKAQLLKEFAELFGVDNPDNGSPSSTPPKSAEAGVTEAQKDEIQPTLPDSASEMSSPSTDTPSSAELKSSFDKIRAIEVTFNTLKANFSLPAELDFLSTPSTTPWSSDSDSDSSSATEHLSFAPTNRPVRSYENALTVLLTQLDSVESLGDAGVRASRKKAVERKLFLQLPKLALSPITSSRLPLPNSTLLQSQHSSDNLGTDTGNDLLAQLANCGPLSGVTVSLSIPEPSSPTIPDSVSSLDVPATTAAKTIHLASDAPDLTPLIDEKAARRPNAKDADDGWIEVEA